MIPAGAGRVAALRERERLLWVAAVVLYGAGDTATTVLGLQSVGVAEAGPVAGPLVASSGVWGLLFLKVAFFLACGGVWAVVRSDGRVAIPLALSVVGAAVTAWNAAVLVTL